MKLKTPLLLGLIFALVCSVSFAGRPPGNDPKTEFKKETSFVAPAVTEKPIAITVFADVLATAVDQPVACVDVFAIEKGEAMVLTTPKNRVSGYRPPERCSIEKLPDYGTSDTLKPDKPQSVVSSGRWQHYLYWQC